MVNKNKTEANFFTGLKVSLAFCDVKEYKEKIRNSQDQTEVFGSFI